ncbi:MAG: CPBP family intramembrane metalloprotease, partial [Myxococcales bacterium]
MPLSTRITSFAILIYVPLAAVALAWARLGQDRLAWSLPSPWLSATYGVRLGVSLGLGLVLALVVIAITPALVERTAWARALHQELKPIVDRLSSLEITLLALTSGFAEELFFRGAMQPVLGLLVTSIIFGAVHTGPKRVFLAWSIWAFIMGLLFGSIFELTGVLWGPVLAHAL